MTIGLAFPVLKIITLIAGVAVLVAGRRLFWLTVGAIGFAVSVGLVLNNVDLPSVWLVVIVGLIAGVAGAVLAMLLQKVAVIVAGVLAGAYLLTWLAHGFFPDLGAWQVATLLAGAIIGGILASVLLETALVVLSAVVGAAMIVGVFELQPIISLALFLVLLAIGVLVQSRSA
ncbi:MAG: DUF4203 domain-containing protein [Chloroflexi bacterium]|nr:MAG: DUF4203 domain-containing protein [Chloroflexota bacterium]